MESATQALAPRVRRRAPRRGTGALVALVALGLAAGAGCYPDDREPPDVFFDPFGHGRLPDGWVPDTGVTDAPAHDALPDADAGADALDGAASDVLAPGDANDVNDASDALAPSDIVAPGDAFALDALAD